VIGALTAKSEALDAVVYWSPTVCKPVVEAGPEQAEPDQTPDTACSADAAPADWAPAARA
jgi:hypothetical protein